LTAQLLCTVSYSDRVATSAVRPLDRREHAAWRTFVETVDDLTAAMNADLAPHGISLGDYQVFVFLSEAAGRRMRMVDLAAALHLSPSGLTRRLDGLTRHGYVDRVPSLQDRRVMLAVLTDSGFAKLTDAYPAHLASVRRRIFDHCSSADVTALGRAFAAIQAGLCDDEQPRR
jgi:DNA-binding MarR family transcriptional regulator